MPGRTWRDGPGYRFAHPGCNLDIFDARYPDSLDLPRLALDEAAGIDAAAFGAGAAAEIATIASTCRSAIRSRG
jgi:hypothetical protein